MPSSCIRISARALMCRRQLLAGMDRRAAAVQLPVRVRNTGSVADSSRGIRAAVPGDISEILKVDHLAGQADLERAAYLRRRVRSGECLVHLVGGSVRGFVVLRPARFFGRDFIDLLVADAAHRRAGIGRALLKAALSTAGADQVFTSTKCVQCGDALPAGG
jgi:GNAT superfamily N-acetyltransferase